jgi:hypothetical protein
MKFAAIVSGPLKPQRTAELLMRRGFPYVRGEQSDAGWWLDHVTEDGAIQPRPIGKSRPKP